MNRRITYIITFLLLLGIEVLIALYVNDNFIRPYVGDMLVVIVVYCFVRIIIPQRYRLMPLYVFIFATFVEGLQYFELVKRLHIEHNTFLRVLIGSVYDYKDIVCYVVGCMLLGLYELYRYKSNN